MIPIKYMPIVGFEFNVQTLITKECLAGLLGWEDIKEVVMEFRVSSAERFGRRCDIGVIHENGDVSLIEIKSSDPHPDPYKEFGAIGQVLNYKKDAEEKLGLTVRNIAIIVGEPSELLLEFISKNKIDVMVISAIDVIHQMEHSGLIDNHNGYYHCYANRIKFERQFQ